MHGPSEFHVNNLAEGEIDKVRGAFRGTQWITIQEGRIVARSVHEALPSATDDDMLPFWRPTKAPKEPVATKQILFDKKASFFGASIIIQHLCGYYYTPERYRKDAAFLENCGFESLRSKRGAEGQYWELWFLPALWSAKGELKTEIEKVPKGSDDEDRIEAAMNFIWRRAPFGTADVTVQRRAMCTPD